MEGVCCLRKKSGVERGRKEGYRGKFVMGKKGGENVL